MKNIGVIIAVILTGICFTALLVYNKTNLNIYKESLKKMSYIVDSLKQKDIRISRMEKTLLVVYDISKYEAHYYSIIYDDFSQKFNVPWEIYPALTRIESNFNPTLTSSALCKGLTQVSGSTGKAVAESLGIVYKETTLWNEILNQVIGFTYFNEGFKDDPKIKDPEALIKHAIKRYCGGPGYSYHNTQNQTYVGEYKTTVWEEYVKLSYIYKGILYDELQDRKESR